jgi:hypothetical protein
MRNRGLQSILFLRQHPPQNNPNRFRAMLPVRAFKGIRPLKSIRARNLQFPPVIRLRSHDQDPPIPRPIGKHMFDDRSKLCLRSRISGVLHLD